MITDKENHQYTKFCWENKIFVYVKPINNHGLYNIRVEHNGHGKTGTQVFRDKPIKGEVSVWEQVRLIYKILSEKEQKK